MEGQNWERRQLLHQHHILAMDWYGFVNRDRKLQSLHGHSKCIAGSAEMVAFLEMAMVSHGYGMGMDMDMRMNMGWI